MKIARSSQSFFASSLSSWLSCNLKESKDYSWKVTFAVAIWRLWTWRCKVCLGEEELSWDETSFVHKIRLTSLGVVNAFSGGVNSTREVRFVSWQPPDSNDAVRLNTDGSSQGNPGPSGAGGVVRTVDGQWLIGFQAKLGICSNNAAELQALRMGLLVAWQAGYRFVQCSVDSKLVVDWVAAADTNFHPV